MKRGIEIEDLLQLRFISSLAASPDKKYCVFQVHQGNLDKNGYVSDLYLFEAEGEQVRRLTASGGAGKAVWLDETRVMYPQAASDETAAPGKPVTEYFALDIHSGKEEPYMRIPAEIIWISPLEEDKFAILAKSYLADEGGPSLQKAERDTWYIDEPDYIAADELPFRQDGLGITNGMRQRVFVYDRKTDALTAVSDPYQNIESISAGDGKIIFSARRFCKDAPYIFYGDVEVYDGKTGRLTVYMDDSTYRVYGVGFMGETPVFAGTRGLLHGYQNENSSFYCFEGPGEPRLLCANDRSTFNTVGTDARYGSTADFAVSEDGIYYIGTEEGNAWLKFAGADGAIRVISSREGTVDDFALLGDKILYAGMHDGRPQELYLLKAGKAARVSDFNRQIAEGRRISMADQMCFFSGETELSGYVIKPADFEENRRAFYPSILYIHGGHKCAFGPVYYHEMQVWANRGFFVIYCNPRGSDGRDDAFADVIGNYGFYEEEDLLAFREACLKAYPQMDPRRMGIGGGSYGGYLTNWMIGRTDCFACAVSQRSIASWNGMFFTSDTNYLFPCWSFENDVWRNPARYWMHSPLKYAENCTTPTLFIHSENDYRCPVSEGISMFQALKFKRVDARLCIFKGESHGLSRSGKPRSRIKRLREITGWYEKYLK